MSTGSGNVGECGMAGLAVDRLAGGGGLTGIAR